MNTTVSRLPSSPGRRFAAWCLVLLWSLVLGVWCFSSAAASLPLPPCPSSAPSGTQFLARIWNMPFEEREAEIAKEILSGNVPEFLRNLCPVSVTNAANATTNWATFWVAPDYLAIGSDQDYYLAHMSPNTAQRIADALGCTLPTPKMADEIYRAAEVKLVPSPIPPSALMTTVPVFSNHNATVVSQRRALLDAHPLGALTAGHQKDLVIASGLASAPGKVAIYGWHQTNGIPIQPLYLKHAAAWVDYSQCVRLVSTNMLVNGKPKAFADVIADPELCVLMSNEGSIANRRYPTNTLNGLNKLNELNKDSERAGARLASAAATSEPNGLLGVQPGRLAEEMRPKIDFRGFQETNTAGERIAVFPFEPEVKITINAPAKNGFKTGRKVLLIFYALPNGNNTAQTLGKVMWPGDDWHYDIQHIAAQTRFLRKELTDRTIVLVCLENDLKSWPAWRKKHGDKLIPDIVNGVRTIFNTDVETVLTGHSGGGSFTFGYLNQVDRIPDDVVRIAFLDSNYAYDPALGHKEKIAAWLKARNDHYLCVLAYNDAVALLNGKSFVSAAGGTWGKSHQMEADLAQDFPFTTRNDSEFERYSALNGRIQFILKENPDRKIFHTAQVEKNGLIHALLSGTPRENKGYEYFGLRAYSQLILP